MKIVKALFLLGLIGMATSVQAKGPDDDLVIVKLLTPFEINFVCEDTSTQKKYTATVEIDQEGFQYNSRFKLGTTGVLILKGVRDYIHYIEDIFVSKSEGYLRAGYMINIDGSNPKGDKFSYDARTYGYNLGKSTISKTLSIKDYPNLKCQ